MPLQAMAQGCPTILANAHGYAEFAHLASQQISCGMSKAEIFIFGDADQWWEPNFEEVCEAMWEMYTNYDSYLYPAAQSAQVIAEQFTWEQTALKLIDAMGGKEALELPDIDRARLVQALHPAVLGRGGQGLHLRGQRHGPQVLER